MRLRTALVLPALELNLHAQEASAPVTLDQRRDVVEALAKELKARYVFPEVADQTGEALKAQAAKGAYDGATTTQVFSEALSRDLRGLGRDGHFRVRFDPTF